MDTNTNPSGFRSRLMSDISREEEDLQDWFRSTQGQIVLGAAGIVFVAVALFRALFG